MSEQTDYFRAIQHHQQDEHAEQKRENTRIICASGLNFRSTNSGESFPPEHRPERDAPHTEQLIDAWIAGFAKHNEITCAAQSPVARPAVAADARELVKQWAKENHPGTLRTNQASLMQRITAYANQRDSEVREVLEAVSKLLTFETGPPQRCWCSSWVHTPACIAARALYEKLSPKTVTEADCA